MRRAAGLSEVAVASTLWLLCSSCGDATTDQASITNREGEIELQVRVELAESAAERAEGLGSYRALGPDEGLLLVFPSAGEVCITNRNVSFPIDAIFISAASKVLHIERALPARDPNIHCHPSTSLVLEVQAGTAANVSKGDTFHLSM